MTDQLIQRRFLTVGNRQVHLRVSGKGPAVLLLHQSPRTSAEHAPMMTEWADELTCIAPDTPGYGLSDPLAEKKPSMKTLAGAVVELLDALCIDRIPVYGVHTGAKIALALAHHFPDRVAGVVANGVLVNSKKDRDDLLAHYLPDFQPAWDGSHLTWLWARMREQKIFFPWYDRRQEARMAIPVGDAELIHETTMDFLLAGAHYADAYAAALGLDCRSTVEGLKVPTLLTAIPGDPLLADVQRLEGVNPDHVTVRPAEGPEHMRLLARDFLRKSLSDVQLDPCWPDEGTAPFGRSIVSRGGVQMHALTGGADGPRVTVLCDPTRSIDCLWGEMGDLTDHVRLTALDLPGQGFTGGEPVDHDALPELLGDAPDWLVCSGPAASKGLALIEAGWISPAHVIFLDAAFPRDGSLLARWVPDLTPQPAGGHLLTAWQAVRDSRMFWPWFRPEPDAAIPTDGDRLDPANLHLHTKALLLGWQTARASQSRWATIPSRLSGLDGQTHFVMPAWTREREDVWHPDNPVHTSSDTHDRAAAILSIIRRDDRS